jgi:outer membrane protein assembly factor BamB
MRSNWTMVVIFSLASTLASGSENWSRFRGPRASGIGEGKTPTRFSVEPPLNRRFRVPVPGLAHSSPIVWGDRIFLTTAVAAEGDSRLKVGLYGDIAPVEGESRQSWMLLSFDKRTGALLWEQTAHEGVPKTKRHPKSTHANPTPATDGQRVLAFFGSEGLYCYDFSGKLLWKRDLGLLESSFFQAPDAQWGFASSPVIYQDMIIIQADVLKDSFLAALTLADGRTLWRTARADVPTWSTPNILETAEGAQVVVNGWKHIGGYEAKTGKEIWRLEGGGDIPVPTPVFGHELVFITNAHGPGSPIFAIRPSARGRIAPGADGTSEHIAWSVPQGGAYMQTPLVYGDYLYSCRDNGVLSCFKATTGELQYRERLGGGKTGFSASPVAADGKLYFTSEEGEIYVVKAGPAFELLAVNPLGEVTMATPAVSEGVLYFRTRSHLVAVAEGK